MLGICLNEYKLQLPEEQVRKLDENKDFEICWRNDPVTFSCFDQNQSILMNSIFSSREILLSNLFFFPPTYKTFFSPKTVAFLLALAFFPKELEVIPNSVSACWAHFPGCLQAQRHLAKSSAGEFSTLYVSATFLMTASGYGPHGHLPHPPEKGWVMFLARTITVKTAELGSQNAHRRLSLSPDFSSRFKRNHSRLREFYTRGFKKLKIKMKSFLLREILRPVWNILTLLSFDF